MEEVKERETSHNTLMFHLENVHDNSIRNGKQGKMYI